MCVVTSVHVHDLGLSVSPRRKGGRDNVDFARLMSLDYQREWLEQRERKQQQQKEKLKVIKDYILVVARQDDRVDVCIYMYIH